MRLTCEENNTKRVCVAQDLFDKQSGNNVE